MLSQSAAPPSTLANLPVVGMHLCDSAQRPTSSIAWSSDFWMHASAHCFVIGVGHATTHFIPPSQTVSFEHATTCGLQLSERHLVTLIAGAGMASGEAAASSVTMAGSIGNI